MGYYKSAFFYMSEANMSERTERARGALRAERLAEKYYAFREVLLSWTIVDLWDGLMMRIDARQKHIEVCEICQYDMNALTSKYADAVCRRLLALTEVIELVQEILDLKIAFDPD